MSNEHRDLMVNLGNDRKNDCNDSMTQHVVRWEGIESKWKVVISSSNDYTWIGHANT